MSEAPTSAPGGYGPADPRGKKVLIVDDDEGILNLVSLLVKTAGFQILTASTGEDGINLLANAPDALILDLIMPGCGGLGVLKHFKGKTGPVPPIIVITAYEKRHHSVQEAMMDPNVVQCLAKPLQHEILLEALHRMLKTEPLPKKK